MRYRAEKNFNMILFLALKLSSMLAGEFVPFFRKRMELCRA
jgi:hypothetical protein